MNREQARKAGKFYYSNGRQVRKVKSGAFAARVPRSSEDPDALLYGANIIAPGGMPRKSG